MKFSSQIAFYLTAILSLASCATANLRVVRFESNDYKNQDIIPHLEEAIRNGAKQLRLSPGSFQVESLWEIENIDGLRITGDNTVLKMIKTPVEAGPAFVKVFSSDRLKLKNIQFDGNRININTNRLIHTIFIYDSKELTIQNVNINNSLGDGIQIASNVEALKDFSRDIAIKNCHITNSRRNGLSLINCRNIKIEKSSFNKSNGESPQAGIDIEPDVDYFRPGVSHVLVRKVELNDNKGNGIAIPHTGSSSHITIQKSNIQRNNSGIWTCGRLLRIERCNISENKSYGICSIRYPEYNIGPDSIIIKRNIIQENKMGIYYRGQGGLIEGNTIEKTIDEGIELRKENAALHTVTVSNNSICNIKGSSAISSDFDEVHIFGNTIENCTSNGIAIYKGKNEIVGNTITGCKGYSVLVNDAYCKVSGNKISDGGKHLIWFNGTVQSNTGGVVINNWLIQNIRLNHSLVQDNSGNIMEYTGNRIKISGQKKGLVQLKKLPPRFNDRDEAVIILQ